jgi:hypothetical protein
VRRDGPGGASAVRALGAASGIEPDRRLLLGAFDAMRDPSRGRGPAVAFVVVSLRRGSCRRWRRS